MGSISPEPAVLFEEAIAKTGGFGTFQKILLFKTLPLGITFVFGVSSMAYVMPAIICEFKVTKYQQGLIYSAVYVGMVLCGGFWGTAADMLGRRCTLIIAGSLSGIFEFLSAFTVNYWQMFLCKFLAGCTTSGVHLTYYIYLSEFVDALHKDAMTIRTGGAAAFGYFIQPLIAAFLVPLTFNFVIFENGISIRSWNVFIMLSSLAPIFGTFVSFFFLTETPKYLLLRGDKLQALQILKKIYAKNLKMPEESFPIQNLILGNDEIKIFENEYSNLFNRVINYIKPLFQYPYFIPIIMSYSAQFITMGSYNTVRQHQPTLFALAFGLGQEYAEANMTSVPFCILFQTQHLFSQIITCDQTTVKLDSRIFYFSSIVGFMIFISFFFSRVAVAKFGKVIIFLVAHIISAIVIALFPYSNAYSALVIMIIYSVCMQNSLTIAVGLMIGRVPAAIRGLTISLIMVVGRVGVIFGNEVLPVITNISCYIGFWSIAFLNLMAIPIMFVYSRQPNPFEEATLKVAMKHA